MDRGKVLTVRFTRDYPCGYGDFKKGEVRSLPMMILAPLEGVWEEYVPTIDDFPPGTAIKAFRGVYKDKAIVSQQAETLGGRRLPPTRF